jgi:nucleoside-diphosphate-sugar epimerase
MTKIAIVGESGFLASRIINEAKNKKIKIKTFSKKNFNLFEKTSIKKLSTKIKIYDRIIFCAAIAPVKNLSELNDNLVMLNNFLCNIENLEEKYFLYISSDAVYKDTKQFITEKSDTDLNGSFHGMMHLFRENILKKIFLNTVNLCIVRPTLVYGPQDPHNGYGPNKFIRDFLNKKDIYLFGKGEEKRDHVFVDDLAKVVVRLTALKEKGIFNIASGQVLSFNKISKLIKNKLRSPNKIFFTQRKGKLHHLGLRKFDITKLNKFNKKFKMTKLKDYLSVLKNIKTYNN